MLFDSYLDFVSNKDLFIYFISDSLNLAFCFLLLSFFLMIKKLDALEYIFWLFLFFLTPIIAFFINENFFPDIGGYLRCLRDLRDNFVFDELGCSLIQSSGTDDVISLFSFKRGLPALIFALIPIPSIATISSVGIINKLILFFTYLYIKHSYFNKAIFGKELLLFLLPTILVFSSIGLRDNLIFCLQVLIIFWMISNRFILVSAAIFLLFMIKIQNGVVMSILYFGWYIFRTQKSFSNLLIYSFFVFLGVIIFSNEILATLNFFKLAFLIESDSLSDASLYVEIDSVLSLVLMIPELILTGLLRPYPVSLFSFITFIENIIVLIILFKILSPNLHFFRSPEFISILLMTIIGLLLNSLVIDNDFSFARYKYPFIYTFIIYIYYLKYRESQ